MCHISVFLLETLSRYWVQLLEKIGVKTCLWSWSISDDQVKVVAKNKNAKLFACELWVKMVGTFGVVLYHNQWPVNFILHFAKIHIGSSIRYENTLLKNYFIKDYIVKII